MRDGKVERKGSPRHVVEKREAIRKWGMKFRLKYQEIKAK